MMWMFPPSNTEWVLNRGGFSCTFSQVIDIGFMGLWSEKPLPFAKHSGSLPRLPLDRPKLIMESWSKKRSRPSRICLLHLDTRLLTSSQYDMTSLVDGALEFGHVLFPLAALGGENNEYCSHPEVNPLNETQRCL